MCHKQWNKIIYNTKTLHSWSIKSWRVASIINKKKLYTEKWGLSTNTKKIKHVVFWKGGIDLERPKLNGISVYNVDTVKQFCYLKVNYHFSIVKILSNMNIVQDYWRPNSIPLCHNLNMSDLHNVRRRVSLDISSW